MQSRNSRVLGTKWSASPLLWSSKHAKPDLQVGLTPAIASTRRGVLVFARCGEGGGQRPTDLRVGQAPMAKNFNVGVSALSELGRAKLDEADAALGAARTWLSAAVQEAKQSIEELCPTAKRQCTRKRAAKPITASDPSDKVREPELL